jgi:cytidylate kinase
MTGQLPECIAIDGPAASGKTTVGSAIARKYGYLFLDTGLMYRAVTLAGLRAKVGPGSTRIGKLLAGLNLRVDATKEGTRVFLGDEDVTPRLRDPDVEANVSKYAAIPAVREAMVAHQRRIAALGKAVLAGRDIGTVVLPDAPLKLYLDASEDARARRRGEQATQQAAEARKDIASRDVVDSSRQVSPLRPAEDAVVIDTTEMTLEEVLEFALKRVTCGG